MADLIGIIIAYVGRFPIWFYQLIVVNIDIIIAIIVGYIAWSYNRGRRYNYLADRWNVLMNINIGVPEFFDPEKTKEYETWVVKHTKTKYCQHARMCWGFVEDVIRNDYFWEFRAESYIDAYIDTIEDIIRLHHTWLWDNRKLFSYPKFSEALERNFGEKHLFSWSKIQGNHNKKKLIKFLTQEFDIDWVKTEKIEKIDGGKTIRASNGKKSLSLILNDEETKVNLKICDGRTDEFFVKAEKPWLPWGSRKLNIYDNKFRKWNPELYMWISRKKHKRGLAGLRQRISEVVEKPHK